MYLIFDTETTGLPRDYNAPVTDLDNWPRVVQLSWQLHAANGKLLSQHDYIIQPDGFTIPFNAEKVHGISTQRAQQEGLPLAEVLTNFNQDLDRTSVVVGHNVDFDINITAAEFIRAGLSRSGDDNPVLQSAKIDTKDASTDFCRIPGGRGGKYKWPTLSELHEKLFGVRFDGAHNSAYDVDATARCFFGLIEHRVIPPHTPEVAPEDIRYERPNLEDATAIADPSAIEQASAVPVPAVPVQDIKTAPFSHLHVHSQFSILQSTIGLKELVATAKAQNMPAVAVTDFGSLFGAFKAVAEGRRQGLRVIIGCDVYMVADRHQKKFTKDFRDHRTIQLLLAKNQAGYHNLSKLCSLGYIEGYYGGYPRVDKELIKRYASDLIATTGSLSGEIPDLILNVGEHQAEEAFQWWVDTFGDDFYVELQRHGLPEENRVNEIMLGFARKYNVKVIATNNAYYLNQEDASAHDTLLCVKNGDCLSVPKGRGRGYRFGFANDEYYFKSEAEMKTLFHDLPEAITNTYEIVEKTEELTLERNILLPRFEIPEGFADQDDYLRHLSFEGAKQRYPEITSKLEDRLNLELKVIKDMGFPGYFLIVQDFINAARRMGVAVGPGRGSAAGSVVAYCTGITNIDPILYDLLFERFLNPERISMPDIDIDFDDDGRQAVIDYVVQKYGQNQVAQIVTFGTMAPRMAIRDVARVSELPLADANRLAKLVPEKPGTTFEQALIEVPELKQIKQGNDKQAEVVTLAHKLVGSVRGTGIHAAGVIIAPDDLLEYMPVKTDKDSDLFITQFDGSVVESAGMLKMDFLGLKTLTIIKTALDNIKRNHGIDIDIDKIPLNDEKTFRLYQRGDTIGTFQFESEGMRQWLQKLKPTDIEDLIAMNALYRPGPMQFIPNFIDRKHGREKIEYPHELLQPILKNSYGICLTGDTRVFDAETGTPYRLDELRNRAGDFTIQGMDAEGQPTTARVTHWLDNGTHPVFRLTLRNGAKIKATANHLFYTDHGWKPLASLEVGSYIGTPPKLLAPTQINHYSRCRLRVLAFLIADGSLASGTSVDFVNHDPQLINAYTEALRTFTDVQPVVVEQVRNVKRIGVRSNRNRRATTSLLTWMRELGLKQPATQRRHPCGVRSHEKTIPSFVYGLANEDIAYFLAGLWDCDGYVGKKLCHYKTISAQLAADVQTLLLRLGIPSVIYRAPYQNSIRTDQTSYQVTTYELNSFAAIVQPFMVSHKGQLSVTGDALRKNSIERQPFLEEVKEVTGLSARGLMKAYGIDRQHFQRKTPRISTTIVEALIKQVALPHTKKFLPINWQEIVSIEACGSEPVYDLTVEGIHNFVANNVIVHNCIYQEQIMQTAQILGGYSLGGADLLRRAMGKKKIEEMNKQRVVFVQGAKEKHGIDKAKAEEVFSIMEKFAQYGFNRSHSAAYSVVAYQTGYLKANYPAEYMAAVLTHNMSNSDKVTLFMDECKQQRIRVLGPDVNESSFFFGVNAQGQIRFGLGAIKGAGESAVTSIIEERENGGAYLNIFDFVKRSNLRAVNKKTMESMAMAGAFDCFSDLHRRQYLYTPPGDMNLLEKAVRYAATLQHEEQAAQVSLFGGPQGLEIPLPRVEDCEPYSEIEKLRIEKEVTGFYISGHPLDQFRLEIENFCTCTVDKVNNYQNQEIAVAGIVSKSIERQRHDGKPFGLITIEDYQTSLDMALFGEEYLSNRHRLSVGQFVFVKGRVEERYNRPGVWELRPSTVQLLSELREKMTRGIRITLPAARLDAALIHRLEELTHAFPGTCALKVCLQDEQENIAVELLSRRYKINPDNQLFDALDQLKDVSYCLATG